MQCKQVHEITLELSGKAKSVQHTSIYYLFRVLKCNPPEDYIYGFKTYERPLTEKV